ncbi:MAG: CatA-like O-acetyltransferase [Bacillota bacterium]
MRKINLESWNRNQTYLFFKDLDVPRYLVTVNLDVTNFISQTKRQNHSFYLSFMHLSMCELNKIENFRYRIIENDVYLLDSTHPSYTDVIEGTEQFKIVTVDLEDDLISFISKAKHKSKEQGSQFIDEKEEQRIDLVYITTFPWAKYTQVSHAHNLDPKDSIPKLSWGKYENENGKYMMPFSIEVHHALVDGLHVGKLIQNIQMKLNSK